MKNFSAILLICLLSSCIIERDFIVDSDYSYRGKFKKYDTFSFLKLGDTVNYNGLSDHMIRNEIEKRMVSQGYRFKEKNPSFYVSYKVFGDNLKFKGYEQLDLESWDDLYSKKAENESNLQYIKEAVYTNREYDLREGTLLIDFVDGQSHSAIWQGYASGLFDDRTYFSKDVKYAVRSILNQYRLLAANYQ